MLDPNPVNLVALLLSVGTVYAATPGPALIGVLGSPDGSQSDLVTYKAGFDSPPNSLLTWDHARGWLPLVTINHKYNQALAVVLPRGSRHGGGAELWQVDLDKGRRLRVARNVAPRQKALFSAFGPLYVTQKGAVKRVHLGPRIIAQTDSDLFWPLAVHQSTAYVLRVDQGQSRLIRLSLASGRIETLVEFGADPVRDFSFKNDAATYQRMRGLNHVTVERVRLRDGRLEVLFEHHLPWLVPQDTSEGVIISLSSSPVRGRLALLRNDVLQRLPSVGQGAPIPMVAAGRYVVIRRQSKTSQSYVVLDVKSGTQTQLNTNGLLLESPTILSGVGQ